MNQDESRTAAEQKPQRIVDRARKHPPPAGKAISKALIPASGDKTNGRTMRTGPSNSLPLPERITRNQTTSITAEPSRAHPFSLNASGSSTTTEELQYAKKSEAQ